ncbi:MAG: hypothetical protein RL322_553 [Pseudomonadota bacterium]
MPPLPRRLRQPSVLITGCGDVGLRLIRHIREAGKPVRIIATARRSDQLARIRAAGGTALSVDLDQRKSLKRLACFSRRVIHLAPPPASGRIDDPRSRRLIAHLIRNGRPRRRHWVYVSTTGVYGDCSGAWIDETQPLRTQSDRARRRVAAEGLFRQASQRDQACATILRAPGIYAADRLPVERLRAGTPALRPEDDVWTNHIHAEDLAQACWLALWRGRPGRAFNVVDSSALRMGEYFDQVADAFGLARPPRMGRAELSQRVSPMMLSFMQESRRLSNQRMRSELRIRLRFPTVADQLLLLNSQASLV